MSRSGGRRRVEEALRISGFEAGRYVAEPLVANPLSIVKQGDPA